MWHDFKREPPPVGTPIIVIAQPSGEESPEPYAGCWWGDKFKTSGAMYRSQRIEAAEIEKWCEIPSE